MSLRSQHLYLISVKLQLTPQWFALGGASPEENPEDSFNASDLFQFTNEVGYGLHLSLGKTQHIP